MIKNKMFSTKEFKVKLIIVASLLAVIILSFFFAENIEEFLSLNDTYALNQVSGKTLNDADYEVTYLDVGQGNCAIIKLPDEKVAIVDAGNTMYGNEIVKFLKEENVTTIDYLIATHADADHIGGFAKVLCEFDVKNIYRPFQISGVGETTEEFIINKSEDLSQVYLDYVEKTNNRSKISRATSSVYAEFIELVYDEFYFENGKKIFSNITVFYDGLKIVGENYSFEFFAPLVREDAINLELMTERTKGFATIGYGVNESNGSSAIFLFSCYGETFLFTGDAPWRESSSGDIKNFEELDFVNSLTNDERLKLSNVSVYLSGHHGSSFSSSEELLNLINPKFVVVSVGKNNGYGHPASDVLSRIENTNGLEEDYLLRTDENGSVTFSSVDGKLKYSYSKYESDSRLTISWYEFGTIIFISISYIVVLIKPKNRKQI